MPSLLALKKTPLRMPALRLSPLSLGEGLLVLYLAWLIAAAGIPKVLQAYTGEDDDVYLAQTAVLKLETLWYQAKDQLEPGDSLYTAIATQQSEAAHALGSPVSDHGPLSKVPRHPCRAYAGWLAYPNGTVIAGLSGAPTPALDGIPSPNTVLCLDLTGAQGPNTLGTDVFFGDFNPTGDFDTRRADPRFHYTPYGRNFFWGNPHQPPLDRHGHPLPGVTLQKGAANTILTQINY